MVIEEAYLAGKILVQIECATELEVDLFILVKLDDFDLGIFF